MSEADCEKCEFNNDCNFYKILIKYNKKVLKDMVKDNCYDFREVK